MLGMDPEQWLRHLASLLGCMLDSDELDPAESKQANLSKVTFIWLEKGKRKR